MACYWGTRRFDMTMFDMTSLTERLFDIGRFDMVGLTQSKGRATKGMTATGRAAKGMAATGRAEKGRAAKTFAARHNGTD